MKQFFLVPVLAVLMVASAMSQTPIRDYRLGQTQTKVVLNTHTATILKGTAVERDTAWYFMKAMGLPDTMTSAVFDPDSSGRPYYIVLRTIGTASGDTVFITGSQSSSRAYPTKSGTTFIDTVALASNTVVLPHLWTGFTQIHSPNTGNADSVRLYCVFPLGVTPADSAEYARAFMGVVLSDSIQADSIGVIATAGPVFVTVNGNTNRVQVNDWLEVGTSGTAFRKWAKAASDTNAAGQPVGFDPDSSRVVAKSLDWVITTGDSAWIELKPPF